MFLAAPTTVGTGRQADVKVREIPKVLVYSIFMATALRRAFVAALVFTGALLAAEKGSVPANYNIPLWEEGKVPLALGTAPLDTPFLTVFLPPENHRNGGSVVVAPGGGNIMLMYGVEGMDIAERYNDWGVTAFVLTYRLSPRYNDKARILAAVKRLHPDRFVTVQVMQGHYARATTQFAPPPDITIAHIGELCALGLSDFEHYLAPTPEPRS